MNTEAEVLNPFNTGLNGHFRYFDAGSPDPFYDSAKVGPQAIEITALHQHAARQSIALVDHGHTDSRVGEQKHPAG